MSGSRPNPAERHIAEQHLGDRLAALVDGELGHDTRDRVLAHLATCPRCKAEADEQRSLKTYFASTAPPGPSESFLARLQGLSEGGEDDRGGPFGPGPSDPVFDVRADGVFGVRGDTFGYLPTTGHSGLLPGRGSLLPDDSRESRGQGFRIHDVGRPAHDRAAASRGRRFAFAAAGAVSLAAIALGGVSTGAPAALDGSSDARGSRATPTPAQGSGTGAGVDTQRRRSGGGRQSAPDDAARPGTLAAPAASTGVTGPGLPGVPQPSGAAGSLESVASPMLTGAAALSPLIRPVSYLAPSLPFLGEAKPSASPSGGPSGSSVR